MKNNVEIITCNVKKVLFSNVINNFAVLICKNKADNEEFQAVGLLPNVKCGSDLVAEGSWKHDKKYGKQFSVKKYEVKLPDTVSGIEQYLGSGAFKGIGPAIAKRITQVFGNQTLDIIKKDPDKLLGIRGIGKKVIERIKTVNEYEEMQIFLYECDIDTSLVLKICKKYGDNCKTEIYKNPYNLIKEIEGIGFTTADSIAAKIDFGRERYERLSAGLLYTLSYFLSERDCYATRNQLLQKSCSLLRINLPLLENALNKMIETSEVICVKLSEDNQQDAIYLPQIYHDEVGVEKHLNRIKNSKQNIKFKPELTYETMFKYDPDQISAIRTAMYEKVMIITGGPGTGKTTTAKEIINIYKSVRAKVLLAAPTALSAKRLSDGTGMEAKTIHRLLEYKPSFGYQRCGERQLKGDLLIVDECSMIDINLMHVLMKAIPDNMSLILIGDADQLPSVGPGNVFRDLIESNKFPVIKLTNIHRQAEESRIVKNAHRINKGLYPDITNGKNTNFYFIEKEGSDEIANTIVDLVENRLPSYFKIPVSSIQVLAPMKETAVGTNNLNRMLQRALNPNSVVLKQGDFIFKIQDKVMQIKNNYEKEVFNGDIGKVHSFNEDQKELTVDFDNRQVIYKLNELNELVLAYATTIHKSQGSEYPYVVMPCDLSNNKMLQRNLLYTAVTRAKEIMVIVGSKKALEDAVRNSNATERNTMLCKNRPSIQ